MAFDLAQRAEAAEPHPVKPTSPLIYAVSSGADVFPPLGKWLRAAAAAVFSRR